MFIVTRIWISISDLDLNSIIESHNENLKNLLNFIIIIKMANGMGSFAFFGFISRPWHFWAHINYHCDPFDTRTPNFYFLGWFSDLFFWPKKRCAFWLKIAKLQIISALRFEKFEIPITAWSPLFSPPISARRRRKFFLRSESCGNFDWKSMKIDDFKPLWLRKWRTQTNINQLEWDLSSDLWSKKLDVETFLCQSRKGLWDYHPINFKSN